MGAYSRGHSFDNYVSWVGAYSRLGTYSRGALNRSITVRATYSKVNAYSIIIYVVIRIDSRLYHC